ncbi:MAG: hypothetical protein MUD12_17165 [Spirochaetes bacterium]|jgi:hypothetical protein|nr:hypothetical protein [Spirochaetota bacterium]
MTVSLKKPISIILAGALAVTFISCRSIDPTLTTRTASFDAGVTPMRVAVNTESIKSCFPGGWRDDYERRLEMSKRKQEILNGKTGVLGILCCSFPDQEAAVNIIRNNLAFGKDSRNVYLSVVVRNVEWSYNLLWEIAGVAVLVPFGYPAWSETVKIDLEAAVMKPDGRVLKVYRARGVDTEYGAAYWGYLDASIPALRYALIAGCADIRKQIEADRENINKLAR